MKFDGVHVDIDGDAFAIFDGEHVPFCELKGERLKVVIGWVFDVVTGNSSDPSAAIGVRYILEKLQVEAGR